VHAWFFVLGAALAITLVPQLASAIDVTELLARMREAVEPGKDMTAEVEFVLANASGEEAVGFERTARPPCRGPPALPAWTRAANRRIWSA
jgi:hypothetical protein